MSGMKPIALTEFLRSLRARGKSLSIIAQELHCGRSHLSQVVNGRRSGGHTWRKLATVLTVDELKLLENCSTWKPQATRQTLCLCGNPRESHRPYCKRCTAVRNREYRAKRPLEGEAWLKAKARSYLHAYVQRGKIVKGLCADCGKADVQAHHEDYSKPLEVIWLCLDCHRKRHGMKCERKPLSNWHAKLPFDGQKDPAA